MANNLEYTSRRDLIAALRRWLRYAENVDLALPVALCEIVQDEVQRRSRDVAQKVINSEA